MAKKSNKTVTVEYALEYALAYCERLVSKPMSRADLDRCAERMQGALDMHGYVYVSQRDETTLQLLAHLGYKFEFVSAYGMPLPEAVARGKARNDAMDASKEKT